MNRRALLEDATPRPWQAVPSGEGSFVIDPGVVISGGYDGWFEGGIDSATDAALIVAAVNEYEVLLDVATAAERVEHAHNALSDPEHHEGRCERCRASLDSRVEKLRSELVRLEAFRSVG